MKGITYCGACADYDIKKHRCKRGAKLESNPQDKFFDDCPLLDAVPVRNGQWISLTDCANAGVYCSICHKKVYKEDYAWCNRKNKVRSAYCPNCGAKMCLEDNDES
jgi:hypothetical protein